MGTPSGVYVRISRDTEGTGLGVARQRKDCDALAKRLGWKVIDHYEDNDVSASKGNPRPEYERMMRDVESGRIRAVIVWDVDRLTRTPRELEDVIDHADKVGLKLASVGGDIDLGTVQGRGMARMKGVFARMEVENSSRRLRSKHAELAAAGKHIGPRPFGWRMDTDANGKMLLDDAEAAVVRECIDRVLRREGLWAIVNDLNARGVETSTGGLWHTQTLRRMLLRWRNAGIRTHKGKEAGDGMWHPIIDRETHERVVAMLTDPRRKTNNRGTARRYLLTGIPKCGSCGGAMVGTNEFKYAIKTKRSDGTMRTRERVYPHSYKCPHAGCHGVTVNMSEVDEFVTAVVIDVLERDGVQVLGGDPAAADRARTQIAALEAKLALAADQFADDRITAEQLARITAKVRPALDAAREMLTRAAPDHSLTEFTGATAQEAWDSADLDRRRNVLAAMGLRITVQPIGPGNAAASVVSDRLTIEWAAA